MHTVSGVQFAFGIYEQWPRKFRFGDIRFRAPGLFERNYHHGCIQIADLRCVLLQLQQVLATR